MDGGVSTSISVGTSGLSCRSGLKRRADSGIVPPACSITLSMATPAVLTSTADPRLLYSTTCTGHGQFVSGGRYVPSCSRSCFRFKRECTRLQWSQCRECRRCAIWQPMRPATADMLRLRATTGPAAVAASTIRMIRRKTAADLRAAVLPRPRVTDLHSRLSFHSSPRWTLQPSCRIARRFMHRRGQVIDFLSRTALPIR
jgi:hypothetical protein